jgi:serine phosphatase RsbU (regulator of sigma subunit)
MRDGYSTRGGPGLGLGSVRRLATEFDIYSVAGRGTAVVARVWSRRNVPPATPLTLGAICQPLPTEAVSGDAWSMIADADRARLLVADGLGHGPDAARAARAAIGVLETSPRLRPAELCRAIHETIGATRGAAVAALEIEFATRTVAFAGVGNVVAGIAGAERVARLVSHGGIVGHQAPRIQEFTAPWPRGSLLVVHSDGISTRWDLAGYPGVLQVDPSLVAGLLYRDHARGTDDVTVLVGRLDEGGRHESG